MRKLGSTGLLVSPLGIGCMPMSEFYGPVDRDACARTVRRAVDLGVTLIDTADAYGAPRYGEPANETFVGEALRGRRHEVVLATKGGVVRTAAGRHVDNSPGYLRRAVDASLTRLRTDRIDLYYLHRHDPRVPVEESVGALSELVAAGKLGHLGLSEVDADTLRRACAVHPIAALQSEYSLLSRHLEDGLIATARELGVGLVAYAPLGRALLTRRPPHRLHAHDLRRSLPRFRDPHLRHNLDVVRRVQPVADEAGCTIAQLSLAWLLAKGPDVVPIPSARRMDHVAENAAAMRIALTPDQVNRLEAAVRPNDVAGARNTVEALRLMNLRTPSPACC